MKAVSKGTISFGLVSIPVKLFSAVEQQAIGFRLLCKKCMKPIKFERYCEGCKSKVKWDETVKALDLGNGQYLPFTQDELKKIKPEKTDRIEIKKFIQTEGLEPIYYHKPYFCAPQNAGDQAYFLFKKVLEDSKKIAIGKFVMREKEYFCSIRPFGQGMLLTTLNYKYEIRDINDIGELEKQPELKNQELEMAQKLVDQLTADDLDLEQFKDTFAEKLREMIRNKEKVELEEDTGTESVEEDSLMDALKASLN